MAARKIVLVTGGNKGIGLGVCQKILEFASETFVLLGSRDASRGDAAVKYLEGVNQNFSGRVKAVQLDVSSQSSVDDCKKQVERILANEKLYGIVNNAGIGIGNEPSDNNQLADFTEMVLNVNTYGMKRVVDAFLPLLTRYIVSMEQSDLKARLTAPDVDYDNEVIPFCNKVVNLIRQGGCDAVVAAGLGSGRAYGLSPRKGYYIIYHFCKAAGNAYNSWLAAQHPDVIVNAITPGWIETDLTRPMLGEGESGASRGMKQPLEGTIACLHCLFATPQTPAQIASTDPMSRPQTENGGGTGVICYEPRKVNGLYYGSDGVRSPLDVYRGFGDEPHCDDRC